MRQVGDEAQEYLNQRMAGARLTVPRLSCLGMEGKPRKHTRFASSAVVWWHVWRSRRARAGVPCSSALAPAARHSYQCQHETALGPPLWCGAECKRKQKLPDCFRLDVLSSSYVVL